MAEICQHCQLSHGARDERIEANLRAVAEDLLIGDTVRDPARIVAEQASCSVAQQYAMRDLLRNVAGAPVKCRGCDAMIYWVTHKNGKRSPYTVAGLNHFIDCPAAAQFGKGRA